MRKVRIDDLSHVLLLKRQKMNVSGTSAWSANASGIKPF